MAHEVVGRHTKQEFWTFFGPFWPQKWYFEQKFQKMQNCNRHFTLEYIFIFIEKMIFLIFRIKKLCRPTRRGLARAPCKNQFFGFSLKGIGLESNVCAPSMKNATNSFF